MRISDWSSDVCSSDLLVKTITRADLERLVEELIKRTLEPCRKALVDAGLKPADIADVVLVGGALVLVLPYRLRRIDQARWRHAAGGLCHVGVGGNQHGAFL